MQQQRIKKICCGCYSFYFDSYRRGQSKYCSKKCRDNYYKQTGTGRFGKKASIIICDGCGVKFKKHVYNTKNHYCSMECARTHQGFKRRTAERIEVTCLNCSTKFISKWYRFRKYCSKKCFHEHKQTVKNCKYCSKKFTRKSSAFKNDRRKYCSNECKWRDGSNNDYESLKVNCPMCDKKMFPMSLKNHIDFKHRNKKASWDKLDYSKEDVLHWIELKNKGLSIKQISEGVNHSTDIISHRLDQFFNQITNKSKMNWREEEDKLLIDSYYKKLKTKDIAERLGRSIHSVANRLSRFRNVGVVK